VSQRLVFIMMLLVLALARASDTAWAADDVLTLEQAVALALENNRTVKNAELEVSKQDDRLAAARTRRLPSLNFNAFSSLLVQPIDFRVKQGDFGTFPTGTPNPSQDVTITTPRTFNLFVYASADQPLSQLYKINLSVRLNELNRQLAAEDLQAHRQSIINDVKKAYFDVLQTQSALEATDESIKLFGELDRVTGRLLWGSRRGCSPSQAWNGSTNLRRSPAGMRVTWRCYRRCGGG
jgi:outer membrane protein TolC